MKKVIISLLCFSMLLLSTACSSSQPETSQVSNNASSDIASEMIRAESSESSTQSINNDRLTATLTQGDTVIESSYDFDENGNVKGVELTVDFSSTDEANVAYTQLTVYQDKFSSVEVNDKTVRICLNNETIQTVFATQTKDTIIKAIQEQGGQIKS